MYIKKCSKCGWEFPGDWPYKKCKFCHTGFKMGYCTKCGEWSDNLNQTTGYCTACSTNAFNKWASNRRADTDTKYEDWLALIKKIPTPYASLTESQWLEACTHFRGCAYCGSDDIQARSMFIDFKNGGRYCTWNIIPACERCATARKTLLNPFSMMDNTLMRQKYNAAIKYGYSLDNLQKIVDYLQSKIGGI